MRVGNQVVFLVLLLLHISPLYSDDSTADDAQFAETLAVELHAMERTAKKYELHRTQEYKDAVAKHCADRIRDRMNEKTQKQIMTDFSKRLFSPPAPTDTSSNTPSASHVNPPSKASGHVDCDSHYPYVDSPSIPSSGAAPADTMGTGYQRLNAYAQHRNRIESQCARAHNRAQALEKENKQIKFEQIQHNLPKGFQQSFKKRGLIERVFTQDVARSQYKEDFYLDLLEKCGEYFTHEQLVQHQYAQMHRWKEYHNQEFRKFIQTFALYSDYIIGLDKHFKSCAGRCFKKVRECEEKAYHFITNQADVLHKKYAQAKKQARQLHAYNTHQRNLCMQEIFTQQMPDLDTVALEWQETHPERAQAYNETIANPQKLRKTQYAISSQAAQCLSLHGFDPDDYRGLYGNPLQHELFRELLDGIELFAQLPQVRAQKPFDAMIRTATLETFADARQITVMGDCLGASKLIDFGESLLRYCSAVAGGFASGVWKGIERTGTDIKHIISHPDQVVMALGLVAIQFGELIHNYVPFDDVMSSTYDEQDCERIAKNWARERDKAVEWWNKTPSHQKIHEIVEVPVGFFTNAILFGCCASFASKLATAACAEALALVQKRNPAIAFAGIATSESAVASAVQSAKEEAVKLLEKITEVEQIAQMPATKIMHEIIDPIHPQKPAIVGTAWNATHEAFKQSFDHVMFNKGENKLSHIFDKKHYFADLIERLGGEENALRAILEAASGKIPAEGVFLNFRIDVLGQEVYIRGRVMDGIVKLGTCFIKELGKWDELAKRFSKI